VVAGAYLCCSPGGSFCVVVLALIAGLWGLICAVVLVVLSSLFSLLIKLNSE
jgi:hypothetical protein